MSDVLRATVRFPEGLEETTEEFVVVYRNQFGVVSWAFRKPGDLWGFFTPEAQAELGETYVEGDEPDTGAGAFLDEGES